MKVKVFQHIFSVYATLAFFSCHEERILLKGCCEYEAIIEDFGNARIYLPTIFTPNGDAVNDWFYVLGDSVLNVINFEVRDRKDNLVFHVKDVEANDPSKGWDGKVDGIVLKGLYSTAVTVEALDGTIGNFESKICNYPCGLMEDEEMISMDGCHFATEWDCWMYFDGCQNLDFPGCFK